MRNIASVRARRRNSIANRIGRLWLNRLEDRTTPTTFTVNLTGDAGVGTGDTGDIRYCVGLADVNGIDDIINFDFASATTITLTGEVAVNDTALLTMTVPSGKPAVTIDANSTGRIFSIFTTSPVTISNLTMTKGLVTGLDGGGINAIGGGSLTIENCVINGNTAGTANTDAGGGIAIGPGGSLVLRNSTVSGNKGGRGAGIYFFDGGSLTVENSTINNNNQGNSANGGGGVYFYGLVGAGGFTISNSTISNNTASSRGGALSIVGGDGTFNIRNSTISGNSASTAGGGIATSAGSTAAILDIQSSIISGNVHASSPDIFHGFAMNVNYSLIGAGNAGHTITGANNLTGTLGSPLDAKLAPLASNGGPTQTRLPLSGSPVRNTGSNPLPALSTDQRGLARVLDGKIDIGSVESSDPAPGGSLIPVPNIGAPAVTPNTVSIVYSDLQSLINVSTIDVNDITITAPDGFTKLAITAAVSDKAVNSTPVTGTYTFTIPGGSWDVADAGIYTVAIVANQVFDTDGVPAAAAQGNLGTFRVTIPQTFTVDITNDEDDGNTTKGDISFREALKLANGVPGSPDSITFDSTVFATQKTITLTLGELSVADGVTITGPAAKVVVDANKLSRVMNVTIAGIGNVVNLSNLIITNGLLAGTAAKQRGGGIFVEDEHLNLTNCTLTNNSAEATGGGIYLAGNAFPTEPGSITIIDSTVSQNASTGAPGTFRVGSGGGISIDLAGKLVMSRSTVSGNSANTQGGGIYFVVSGSTDISQSAITGNFASGSFGGGGFYFYGTVVSGLKITNTTISGNSATGGPGGGIALNTFNGTSKLQIFNSTITANEANTGGGISLFEVASLDPLLLSSTIVAGNNSLTAIGMDVSIEVATNVSGDNNLIGIADDGNATFTGTGNVNGTQATPQDAKLGALSSLNGGPTATHALLTGSAAINAGNNLLTLANDQRGPGFNRVSGASADIGAFEVQPAAVAAKVSGVAINSKLLTPVDKAQRSYVSDVAITFDSKVAFLGTPEAAFTLDKVGGGSVTLSANVDNTGPGTVVTLTFTGGSVNFTSLADGRYALHALAGQFTGAGLDGDGNGTGGDNFIFDQAASPAALDLAKVFRIFGDYTGDGTVAANDFIQFRLALGNSSPPFQLFDFDNDGAVAASDFIQFRLRFGGSI